MAVANQVSFFVALSAELPNYFLFAFWAVSDKCCLPSVGAERSRMSVTGFALFLRWSDGHSC